MPRVFVFPLLGGRPQALNFLPPLGGDAAGRGGLRKLKTISKPATAHAPSEKTEGRKETQRVPAENTSGPDVLNTSNSSEALARSRR